jgi:endoglucanase
MPIFVLRMLLSTFWLRNLPASATNEDVHQLSRGLSTRALVAATALGWFAVTAPSLAVPSVTPAAADDTAAAVPLARWPLGDTATGVAHDAVGGHDGTVQGAVATGRVAQGPGTTAMAFDGASAQVTVPAEGLAPGAVAAGAWLRTAQRAGAGIVVDTGGIAVEVAAGHPVAITCWQQSLCASVTAPVDVADGTWHQVTASVAGTTASLFVDGVLVATGTTGGTSAAPADDDVAIGRGFQGDLDRVAVYGAPVTAAAADEEFRSGACPQRDPATPAVASATRALPALPLHTRGRFVVDAHGHRVKLAGVNWYGAEELDRVPAGLQCQTADAIASRIVAAGFDVVRLPWATDTWTGPAPSVPPVAVAANPQLRGRDARAAFDAVVAALARHGLLVILDNHVTRADWCCSGDDGNALWWEGYLPDRPPAWSRMSGAARASYVHAGQARWFAAWRALASRYRGQPAVVGADLRNEPRRDRTLGIGVRWTGRHLPVGQDWPRAARRAGNAVLRANPSLLVLVEGSNYATDLRGVARRPVRLAVAHRLVYSAHDYAFTDRSVTTSRQLRAQLGAWWGWLLVQHRWWTTPVLVGEFGSCHPEDAGCADGAWMAAMTAYLRAGDLDWTYWSMNGTGARGSGAPVTCDTTPRFPGCPEGYGLSDATWSRDASPALSATLRTLSPASQG